MDADLHRYGRRSGENAARPYLAQYCARPFETAATGRLNSRPVRLSFLEGRTMKERSFKPNALSENKPPLETAPICVNPCPSAVLPAFASIRVPIRVHSWSPFVVQIAATPGVLANVSWPCSRFRNSTVNAR
jgi:hypothetical protein